MLSVAAASSSLFLFSAPRVAPRVSLMHMFSLLLVEMRERDIASHFSSLLALRASFTSTLTPCD